MTGDKHPSITHEGQLDILTCWDDDGTKHVAWYHFTSDDEAYFGSSKKGRFDITLEEFADGLERIDDDAIYPELPHDAQITTAPEKLDYGAVYVKRSGLKRYKVVESDDCGAKQQMLTEALIMEKISKTPHPYIVRYHGCKVHRGRITGIALEKLGRTLDMCAYKMVGRDDNNDESRTKFEDLDKDAFLAGVESAIKFLHSLGLAHNDISPANIMLREADDGSCMPVLIDFDSCAPFGERLMTFGTPGFTDEDDKEWAISHKKHDEFALKCLREWWDKDHTYETHPAVVAFNKNREE
ncbi:kinase-like domain-containing protein [Achaetomium macrosporum]|uniref:Kinase-like domain-containing protein n=1 Tax=Achaetomium macrosporum TaxID=79813 RepID=A0AAN7C3W7_9PEZI|nr:kinase-like domain-containing protein [Achaetomium macrosporum]